MADTTAPKPIDISVERFRTYRYGDGTEYRIEGPKDLYIMPSGGHRVVDSVGNTHAPRNPWVAIMWQQKNGKAFDF